MTEQIQDFYSWRDKANCRDSEPEIFEVQTPESIAAAKAICAECAVVEQCFNFAEVTNQYGETWGGMSAEERRIHRRQVAARIAEATQRIKREALGQI